MIVGEFDELGRPYVESRLIIPRLQVDERILFLLDTGADRTCLHPQDANRVRIPFRRLGNMMSSRGVGGSSSYFSEPATLSFSDQSYTRLYAVGLLIAEPHGGNRGLPSLLGRDVINHWYMQYDPMNSKLEFTVRHTDYTLDAS